MIKAFVQRFRQEYQFEHYYATWEFDGWGDAGPSRRQQVAAWWAAVWFAWKRTGWWPLVCAMRGHDLTVTACDPEHGSEDIACNRCGWSHHAQF